MEIVTFNIPGFRSTFIANAPIIPGGNFTWIEALNWPLRVPTKEAAENILETARRLQVIRSEWGLPIIVTSWYRPEPFNARAGGVPGSLHTLGKAVDFYPANGDIGTLWEVADERWQGGLIRYSGHIHCDTGRYFRQVLG